jgi:hypothetical protein
MAGDEFPADHGVRDRAVAAVSEALVGAATEDDIRACVVPTTLPRPSLPEVPGVTPQ